MPIVDRVDDRVVARTEFTEKDLIKQVPGFTWDPATKLWSGPLSWSTCVTLRGVFGVRLQVGPALQAWAWEERQRRIDPALALRGATAYTERLDPRLYAFQEPGVDFLRIALDALLADEMGTGKTVQATVAANRIGDAAFPICCVVPNSVKGAWAEHWATWADGVESFVIAGSAARRRKLLAEAADAIGAGRRVAVIINWEAVRLHSRLAPFGSVRLRRCRQHGGQDETVTDTQCEAHPKELNELGFRTVIVDEAHKQKEPKAKQTRAVWAVQHGHTVERRWSLTGTPIANHPGDLWAIMHGVAPVDYPARTRFTDRYCLLSWNAFGGLDIVGVRPDTRDEFFAILDPRMRRMPKDLVLPFLPPKVRVRREVEMSTKQAKAYRAMENGMVTRLDDGRLVLATNNLTQNLRLLQFSSAYAEVNDDGAVRLSEPSSKIDALVELLAELGDKPAVVCAESRQLIELACARLDKEKVTWRSIVGGQTTDQRDANLRDFQEGRARVMLFTVKAGGVGLTMTRADTVIFLQRSWSMLDNVQAEDRVHRIGAEGHESIAVVDIVAAGTVEVDQIARLYEKAARLEEIVRDRAALRAAGKTVEADALDAEAQLILGGDLTGRTNDDGHGPGGQAGQGAA